MNQQSQSVRVAFNVREQSFKQSSLTSIQSFPEVLKVRDLTWRLYRLRTGHLALLGHFALQMERGAPLLSRTSNSEYLKLCRVRPCIVS